MKKNWLGKTVLVILVVGLLAAGGYALYRVGYVHGAQASVAGEMPFMWSEGFENMPHANYAGAQNMPFGGRGSRMMDGYSRTPFSSGHMSYGMTGMTGLFFLPGLFRVLFWGALIWLGYKLVTGSGWKLTREPAATVVDEKPIE